MLLEKILEDKEEFEKRQKIYNRQLQKKITDAKRATVNYLNEKHNINLDQTLMRRLSYCFSINNYTIPKELGVLPLPIGKSVQDTMHHTHYIKACLLLHYRNKMPENLPFGEKSRNICTKNSDTTIRLEEQWKVYFNLMHIVTGRDIPVVLQKHTPVTNKMLYDKLIEIQNTLSDMCKKQE